jgi:hypothetical protein
MPALISPAQARKSCRLRRGSFEMHFPRRFTFWLKLLRLLPYRAYFPLARRPDRGLRRCIASTN